MEYCSDDFSHKMANLNLSHIRQSCIQACLDAMVAEIRFTYTDMFKR